LYLDFVYLLEFEYCNFVLKTHSIKGGVRCQEETEQALSAKGREQEEVWVEAEEEAEWEVIALAQGQAEIASALNAERRFLTRQELHVTILAAPNAEKKWFALN